MNRLDGKVALAFCTSRGIGAATAKLKVEAGAQVVFDDVLESQRPWAHVKAIKAVA